MATDYDPGWCLAWMTEAEHRAMVARMAAEFAAGDVPWSPDDVGYRAIMLDDGRVFTAPLGTPDPFPDDPSVHWSDVSYIPPRTTRA